MVFIAGQRHMQAHIPGFEHFGLEPAAFDEGDLFFGELAGDFDGQGHGGHLLSGLSASLVGGWCLATDLKRRRA
ncbi:hypothetical protein D9M68_899300 [compost metagenome]